MEHSDQLLHNKVLPGTAGHPSELELASEEAWIEVVQQMDLVYADLIESQAQLERQNAALEETRAFMESVLAAMTDVLIVCDPQGNIQQVNSALEHITGLSESKWRGRPISELFAEGHGDIMQRFQDRVETQTRFQDCEVQLVSANGQPAPMAMNCTARKNHRGKLVGMVLVGRPIGELRKAYKKLDEAHRSLTRTQQQLVVSEKMAALGRLVAGVAHELNNPISFVFGNMHALKRYGSAITEFFHRLDKQKKKEDISALRKELKIDRIVDDISPLVEGTLEGAERVSDIVQSLRRFASPQEEMLQAYDLVKVVQTATDWVIKTERHKPQVELDLPTSCEIHGRKGQVHQILVNLVQNAVDALKGSASPSIRIGCHTRGDKVEVSVSDNGEGISRQQMDRIFEPFYTTKPAGQGTGLGLYISYGMAQKEGGDLKVSASPGSGCTFTLSLPVNGQQ